MDYILLELVLHNFGVGIQLEPHDPSDHQQIKADQDPAFAVPGLLAVFLVEDQHKLALVGNVLTAAVIVVRVAVIPANKVCLLRLEISVCFWRVEDVLVGE